MPYSEIFPLGTLAKVLSESQLYGVLCHETALPIGTAWCSYSLTDKREVVPWVDRLRRVTNILGENPNAVALPQTAIHICNTLRGINGSIVVYPERQITIYPNWNLPEEFESEEIKDGVYLTVHQTIQLVEMLEQPRLTITTVRKKYKKEVATC
jgi:hypothetical protein